MTEGTIVFSKSNLGKNTDQGGLGPHFAVNYREALGDLGSVPAPTFATNNQNFSSPASKPIQNFRPVMFLVKNSKPLRPKLLLGVESLLNDAVPAVHRLSHSNADSDEKECFKYRPSKSKEETCKPLKVHVPPFYRQLEPCKTDKQLALQHPRDLGKYGRCEIEYKPEYDCMDPCILAVRLDDTMYKPSPSLDRKYDKYWVDCCIRRPKRCCRKVPPERSYRVVGKSCERSANAKPCVTHYPMPCKQEKPADPKACPRFSLCNCPPLAHTQVNCRLAPRLKRCRRRPCMYPSFSECQHDELNVLRPIECRCLEKPLTCDIYRYEKLTRRGACDKPDSGYDEKC